MMEIEARIRPLVDALNATGLVQTFSSCEGHFAPEEQTLVDRNQAEVRFIPASGIQSPQVERLLASVLIRFKQSHGLVPTTVTGFKLFTPLDEVEVEETFVLQLRPFNRFDSPNHKRADTDRAIQQIVAILGQMKR
ncbi:hypothetical protein EQG79_11180 [Spirosoma sordidisoli]|uniref:Uncharacterized protein n=2 Tax=Spirosoma sordidisoli TaxID=2502893 RepID=A0A4Q2UU76_9BACT|nr:hypothetical protein EQG79_11180 [Spirosoma sordidisoli]